MAFVCVSGEPGCRTEELARLAARSLDCELVTESSLDSLIANEFGPDAAIPPQAWADVVTSIMAHLGTRRHVLFSAAAGEMLLANFAGVLRVHLVASASRRTGDLMIARGLDRADARRQLASLGAQVAALRRARFGKARLEPGHFDAVLNAGVFVPEQIVELIQHLAAQRQLFESGLLTSSAEAQVQFQARLRLAKFGIVPRNRARPAEREFGHPSEEIFANLLDFYRVEWEYEPRSFPLQWGADGKVTEAFTPDFFLPELDLYVELTTMKQALVTRKNRKIRRLRAIYPHINIQVFYQKDIQDLVMKYGLSEKAVS